MGAADDKPLNSQLLAQAGGLAPGFAREFDVHVYYYDERTRELARELRERALLDFGKAPVFVGLLLDRKVGPHPQPMFEINFPERLLGEVILWLLKHRAGLDVLVHRVTDDDYRDHSEGAIWLGKAVPIDFSKFAGAEAKR